MAKRSARGHGREAHGGRPAGRKVKLPRGAKRPIKVFINGMEQVEGLDYTMHEGKIVFAEPIIKEDLEKLGVFRKLSLGLGLVGNYEKNETVDIEYTLSGRAHLASDLAVLPD